MNHRHTGDILRHLEKQNEHLMDAYRSMSHELHKLQVEEEMLMRKFYELMAAQGLAKKNEEDNSSVRDGGKEGQSSALIPVSSDDPIGQSSEWTIQRVDSSTLLPVCSDGQNGQSSALIPSSNEQ